MGRSCPECQNLMKVEVVDGVKVDVCQVCGGTWFNAEELGTMLKASRHAIQDLERVVPHLHESHAECPKMICPDDRIRLDPYHYEYSTPVILHGCEKCGGFFMEAADLLKMEQVVERAPARTPDDAAEDIAKFAGDHERFMSRQTSIRGVFQELQRFTGGWYL